MFKRFLIGFIILFLVFSVFPHAPEAEASTISKKQVIIVNKKVNKLAFYENGKLVKTYSVATGRTSKLTPEGTFYIREKIVNRPYYKHNIPGGDPRNPLGKRWMGLSKRENGGYPYGIHGNANESSIGKHISGGCIRMHNKEVIELYSKVKVGTTVVITTSSKTFNQLAAPFYKNIDIKAPSVPVVNPVGDNVKEVSGITEKGATVTVTIGSKKYIAKPADSKGKFKVTIPKQKAGQKILLSAKDQAGNISGTKTVVVKDKTAPSAPIVNPVADNVKEVSGKTEAYAYITVTIGSMKYPVKRADAKGNYKVIIPQQKAGNKISVKAADAAKNVSSTRTVTVLDKTAPTVTVNPVADNMKEVSGKTEAYAYITVTIGSMKYQGNRADKNGNYKVTIPQQNAGIKIDVTAMDNAKNISKPKSVVVIDKTAPAAPTVITVPDSTTTEITGTSEAKATITIKVGSTVIGTGIVDAQGNFKVVIQPQVSTTLLNVTATDAAKNVSVAVPVTVN